MKFLTMFLVRSCLIILFSWVVLANIPVCWNVSVFSNFIWSTFFNNLLFFFFSTVELNYCRGTCSVKLDRLVLFVRESKFLSSFSMKSGLDRVQVLDLGEIKESMRLREGIYSFYECSCIDVYSNLEFKIVLGRGLTSLVCLEERNSFSRVISI